MTEKRKKGNGYDEVRDYVLGRLRDRASGTFVRILGEEIARAIEISPQTANEHVRALVRVGEFHRERRCYFAARPPAPPESPGSAKEPPARSEPLPADETTWTVPVGNLLRIFTDAEGNVHLVFCGGRQPSEKTPTNLPATFAESSEASSEGSRRFPEGSQETKKESQEIKNEIKKALKSVSDLGKYVDVNGEHYRRTKKKATDLFNRYGAGVKRGTNPSLINRFVAGFLLGIPLITFEELEDQLKQAEREHLEYESWRGFGKRTGIRRPFVRIAHYLQQCFEADHWTWTKLAPPLTQRLNAAHRALQDNLPHADADRTALPAPARSSLATPGMPTLPPEHPPPDGKPSIPSWIGHMIDESGIGRRPPKPPPPIRDPGGQ